jgi:hypothetical protein
MEKKYSNEDGNYMPDKIDALLGELEDYVFMMSNGAPGEELKELIRLVRDAGVPQDWEQVWGGLREAYNTIAERMMNIENGGAGGRPMPEVGDFFERLQENAGELVEPLREGFRRAAEENSEIFSQLSDEAQALVFEKLPEDLLKDGPNVVSEYLRENTEFDRETIERF